MTTTAALKDIDWTSPSTWVGLLVLLLALSILPRLIESVFKLISIGLFLVVLFIGYKMLVG